MAALQRPLAFFANTRAVLLAVAAVLPAACCRELLGKHLHFEVLRGAAAIEEAEADEQLAPAAAAAAASGSSGSSSSSRSSGGGGGRRRLKWVRQRPAVLLPWGTGKQAESPLLLVRVLTACCCVRDCTNAVPSIASSWVSPPATISKVRKHLCIIHPLTHSLTQ